MQSGLRLFGNFDVLFGIDFLDRFDFSIFSGFPIHFVPLFSSEIVQCDSKIINWELGSLI